MIMAPLFTGLATLCISFAAAPECGVKMVAWYQQYIPQNDYSYNPSYSYPASSYPGGLPPASETQANLNSKIKKTSPEAPRRNAGAKTKSLRKSAKTANRWLTDFDIAWARAQEQGKPLVAIFVQHGCPECDRMDATLAQPSALQALNNAVKVRLEFSQNTTAVHRFGITLTPTFLVLSPAHNGEVYREVGALTLQRLRQLKPSIDSLVTASGSSSSSSETRRVTQTLHVTAKIRARMQPHIL